MRRFSINLSSQLFYCLMYEKVLINNYKLRKGEWANEHKSFKSRFVRDCPKISEKRLVIVVLKPDLHYETSVMHDKTSFVKLILAHVKLLSFKL